MEMHQVRYFLAVARTLNFTRAAEECNVSQPALTRAIQQLEEELSGKLLRREGKLSHLTELGERMVPLVRQCYESALAAKTLASSFKKGAAQVLSIALSHTIDLRLLAECLAELQRAFSGLQLKILRGGAPEIGETLKRGQVELAIAGPLGQSWERLDAWPLFEELLTLTVGRNHRLANAGVVDSAELAAERLLMMPACESAATTARILEEAGLRASESYQLAVQNDITTLVAANLGVAFLPETAVAGTELHQVSVKGLEMGREVFLYAVAGRQRSTAGEALMKLLRARAWPGHSG
jgi:DNA-binding transcriptional LysR family regulator